LSEPRLEAVGAAILELLAERGPERTICPSEAARRLAGAKDWRCLMPSVRAAAAILAAEGRIVVTQRGRRVESDAPGPIRLGRPRPPG
jgi:hypothetical protein